VRGSLPEELSPLAYHVPLSLVASELAGRLGRVPLRRDEPGFRVEA
jgi:hypothetical protein